MNENSYPPLSLLLCEQHDDQMDMPRLFELDIVSVTNLLIVKKGDSIFLCGIRVALENRCWGSRISVTHIVNLPKRVALGASWLKIGTRVLFYAEPNTNAVR